MCLVFCNPLRARFSATRLTPVLEHAVSIAHAETQPAASKQLPAPKCASSHALARSSEVRVPPRFDKALISVRFINGVRSGTGARVSPPVLARERRRNLIPIFGCGGYSHQPPTAFLLFDLDLYRA